MKHQVFNPYLPETVYIPDGEPYVFGDRLYIFGSHDRFNGITYCMEDYECWSAPVDDLSDWKCEGTIYHKKQDPRNRFGSRSLYAPDVTKGADGRYYLYYALDVLGIMSVAVCDTPAGHYEYLGDVHYADGTIWGRREGDQFPFDPGVLTDDDGRIYLYAGLAFPRPCILTGMVQTRSDGGCVLELEPDMMTIKQAARVIFPKEGEGSFPGHEFLEASSIRKIDGRYYFIYSSRNGHELCCATADSPTGPFTFRGTLVDIGDLYLDGNEDESHAKNYLGNTHGSIIRVGDSWYVFYHRQTNRHPYSRQACAERIEMDREGLFRQAEVTSCGLNGGPLAADGTYGARIACNLWSKTGTGRYDVQNPRKQFEAHPYFTQSTDRLGQTRQYLANMRDMSVAGFKYFEIRENTKIQLKIRGRAKGKIRISEDEDFINILAEIPVDMDSGAWVNTKKAAIKGSGVKALYFRFEGSGALDFFLLHFSI